MEREYENINLIKLQSYSDRELCELFVYTDKIKNADYKSKCMFVMCIMEINRRNNTEPPDIINVIGIANIYKRNGSTIFQGGKEYEIYCVDNYLLIYDDDMLPCLFSKDQNNELYVWKFFVINNNKITYTS